MSKHTKGPWMLGDSDLKCSQLSVHGGSGKKHNTIARMVHPDHGMDIAEIYSNSLLIAAAPELLGALADCVEHMHWTHPLGEAALKKAKAAIAKATGEQK